MLGWLSQLSIRLLVSAQVMISGSWHRAPRWALSGAWSLLKILSPSPSAPPTALGSLSKKKKKDFTSKEWDNRGAWVAQWLSICLRLRAWSRRYGIKPHIRLLHWEPASSSPTPPACVPSLAGCLSLCQMGRIFKKKSFSQTIQNITLNIKN